MPKSGSIGSAGSRIQFDTPRYLNIDMGANEYPYGTLRFTDIKSGGAYWYNKSSTTTMKEDFYLCNSTGEIEVYLFTLELGPGGSTYGYGVTATISASEGKKLKDRSIYLKNINRSGYGSNHYIGLANYTGVSLEYDYDSFAVSVSAGTGGSAVASTSSATPGSSVTITCTPSTGYSANTPTASGITFTSAGSNKWTFTMPSSAVTVSCTFSKVNYTVTTSPGTGGSASASKTTANYGDSITITCTPSTGYTANAPTASGITFTSAGTNKWSFTMPASNVSISCTFNHVSYTVSASAGTGGTASSDMATAHYQDTPTITCTPSTGYSANTPTASGITFTSAGTNKWKFTMPASNVTVSCTFSKINYTVTASTGTGGTASASKSPANYGDTITITSTPSAGYTANTPTASGITFTSAGTNKWSFTMPASNVTVSCTFSKINYSVSVASNPAAGGTVTRNKSTAQVGDTVTLTRTASAGYQFSSWTTSPTGISINNSLQFTMPASNVTITANWSKINYTVSKTDGTGGSSSLSKTSANYGDSITITCTPNTGYSANTPTATGITFTSAGANKWTFSMPASNVTVSCTFTHVQYNVTVASNPAAGGTLATDKAKAYYNDTVTLTRTAASGYQFSGWSTSPSNLNINSSLKFTMPAQAVSVTANWSKIGYSVTVSPGTGGTASSNKATAQIGDTVTITCTPSAGYTANTPTASGITFTGAGANKWSFTMKAAAVTVSCTFSKITYTITKAVSPSGAGTVTAASTGQVGDQISVSQTPANGYYFNGWSFNPSGPSVSSGKFTMPANNITVTANYLKYSTGTLSSASMTGNGSVTLNIVADKTTYSHKYKLSFGTNMETSLTNVAAGTTSVTISVPDGWSNYIPNATQKTGGTLTLETYNGNTKIGTYTISSLTYNVRTNAVPSIGTITTSIVRTVGGTTYANVGDYYVQNKSAVRTQASASGALGSTISSIELTMSGYTDNGHKKTVSAASIDFTSGLLTISGTCTITLKATDSRGRITTKTANISVTSYNKPSGSLTVRRVNNAGTDDPLGTYAKYVLSKSYTAVGSNSLTWRIVSQNVTANSPANSGDLLPGSRQSFGQTSEYPITLTLIDAFETVNIQVTLPTAQFMIFVNSTGDRIAFMKATNDSLNKNGKSGTIEFSSNHQIYIGNTKLEDYIRGVINGTIT